MRVRVRDGAVALVVGRGGAGEEGRAAGTPPRGAGMPHTGQRTSFFRLWDLACGKAPAQLSSLAGPAEGSPRWPTDVDPWAKLTSRVRRRVYISVWPGLRTRGTIGVKFKVLGVLINAN